MHKKAVKVKYGAALYQKIDVTGSTICMENSFLHQKQRRLGAMPLCYLRITWPELNLGNSKVAAYVAVDLQCWYTVKQ